MAKNIYATLFILLLVIFLWMFVFSKKDVNTDIPKEITLNMCKVQPKVFQPFADTATVDFFTDVDNAGEVAFTLPACSDIKLKVVDSINKLYPVSNSEMLYLKVEYEGKTGWHTKLYLTGKE